MTSSGWQQVVVSGLVTGCLYAILLLGVLIVFQVSKSINFAYGQISMVAALGGWFLYSTVGLPVWLSLVLAAAAATAINTGIERFTIRRIPEGRPGFDLVVTLGIFLLLAAGMQQLVDANSHSFISLGADDKTSIGQAVVSSNDLVIVGLAIILTLLTQGLMTKTSLGTSLRACAEDPVIAASAGINVGRLRTGTWAVAGLLAAVVGCLVASRLTVDAFFMTPVLIKVFIAGMIGGLDRFLVPLTVAVLLGVYEGLAVLLLGSNAGTPAVFLLIIVALGLMPARLANERNEVRA